MDPIKHTELQFSQHFSLLTRRCTCSFLSIPDATVCFWSNFDGRNALQDKKNNFQYKSNIWPDSVLYDYRYISEAPLLRVLPDGIFAGLTNRFLSLWVWSRVQIVCSTTPIISFFFHSCTVHLDTIKVFYLPTDAQ